MTQQLELLSSTDADRTVILTAILTAARTNGGVVSANDYREAIRGRVHPKHVGLVTKELIRRKILHVRDMAVRSNDEIGGNRGRLIDTYRCDLPALTALIAEGER